MVEEKIIEKIRKVLALTKSNYQEEAEAALLKAQELLAQHGLTMSEVQQRQCEAKQVVDVCISQKRRNFWYEKKLSAIIGENFRCGSYTSLGVGIYFIGLKEDVEIASEVFLYALDTMLYLAKEYVRKYRNEVFSTTHALRNDYIIGFLDGLEDKFKEQVESKGYSLILAKDALVVKAITKKGLRKGRASSIARDGSSNARKAGYRDGKSFNHHSEKDNQLPLLSS